MELLLLSSFNQTNRQERRINEGLKIEPLSKVDNCIWREKKSYKKKGGRPPAAKKAKIDEVFLINLRELFIGNGYKYSRRSSTFLLSLGSIIVTIFQVKIIIEKKDDCLEIQQKMIATFKEMKEMLTEFNREFGGEN